MKLVKINWTEEVQYEVTFEVDDDFDPETDSEDVIIEQHCPEDGFIAVHDRDIHNVEMLA